MRLIYHTFTCCIATFCLMIALNASASELNYNLISNTPLAHHQQSGILVDLNDVGVIKYLRDAKRRWVYDKEYEGRKSLLPNNIRGEFWVPITQDMLRGALNLEVILAPLGKKQRVDVFINGKKLKNIVFSDEGWQRLSVSVDGNTLTEGIAHIKLHFRGRHLIEEGLKAPAAFRALRLADAGLDPLPVEENKLQSLLSLKKGKSIQLNQGHGVDYYVIANPKNILAGQVDGSPVELWTQLDGGEAKKMEDLKGAFKVSLAQFKGQPVRLMFRARKGTATLTGQIGDHRSPKRTEFAKPKYVIFWLIDTLRADKLSFYKVKNSNGRKKVNTPNLEKLAKESLIVEPYYVQGNESKASHASLFTGVYPTNHKVYTEKAKLPKKLVTIAELMKQEGYHTGGFVSNGYISDRWDFAQGFKDFTNFIREGKANNAKAIVKAAKKWIKKKKKKPFYLYLGTSDPHVTYRRHKEFIGDYDELNYEGPFTKYLSGTELGKLKGKKPPKVRTRNRIEALYENEIAFNDKYFGELVKSLKDEGIYDDTMIIVSSDHGDEFWEHGSCGHGHSLFEELISVPLMIRWPQSIKPARFEAGAGGVDVLPTLIDLLGAKSNTSLQGRSLLPQLGVKDLYPQARMASKGKERYALTIDKVKAVFKGRGSVEVYDLNSDPTEQTSVSKTKMILSLSVLDPINLYLSRPATWSKSKWGAPNALSTDFPSEFPKSWTTAP